MTLYNYTYEHTNNWDGNGRCPHCGEYDSEVLDEGAEDDYYYYVMRCYNCNTRFTDWYQMVPREREWVTADEMREQEDAQDGRATSIPSTSAPQVASVPAPQVASVPPSSLPEFFYEDISRHNYDLIPKDKNVSDNPVADILAAVHAENAAHIAQCRCDTATRNLRMPKANWQAINEALSDS